MPQTSSTPMDGRARPSRDDRRRRRRRSSWRSGASRPASSVVTALHPDGTPGRLHRDLARVARRRAAAGDVQHGAQARAPGRRSSRPSTWSSTCSASRNRAAAETLVRSTTTMRFDGDHWAPGPLRPAAAERRARLDARAASSARSSGRSSNAVDRRADRGRRARRADDDAAAVPRAQRTRSRASCRRDP